MKEKEWLESKDPKVMLDWLYEAKTYHSYRSYPSGHKKPSDRKLRLFACACAYAFHPESIEHYRRVEESGGDSDEFVANLFGPTSLASVWVNSNFASGNPLLPERPPADRGCMAALLRDIVGNPFRPLTFIRPCFPCNGTGRVHIPEPPHVHVMVPRTETCRSCQGMGRGVTIHPPWITPQVLSLAAAAYEERPGRECVHCDRGNCPKYGPVRQISCSHCGGHLHERQDVGNRRGDFFPKWCEGCWATFVPEHVGYERCPECHGTGRVEDGSLDPVRLAILADALEEAGCPQEVMESVGRRVGRDQTCVLVPNPLLAHLRETKRWVPCWACAENRKLTGISDILCNAACPGGEWKNVTHVRGCFCLDAILGKE